MGSAPEWLLLALSVARDAARSCPRLRCRLNQSMQHRLKSLRWGFECQSLPWPFVELTSHSADIARTVVNLRLRPCHISPIGGDRRNSPSSLAKHRHPPRLVVHQPIWSPSGATRRYVRNRARSGSARVTHETTSMTLKRTSRLIVLRLISPARGRHATL
jgi:hypothetical protein